MKKLLAAAIMAAAFIAQVTEGFSPASAVKSDETSAKKTLSGKTNIPEFTMVEIPGRSIKMMTTEVTQELYEVVMGENPSYFKPGKKIYVGGEEVDYKITPGENAAKLPVENVSWYDAIYFCNKLSEAKGLTPVYAVNGETDVTKWNYTPHKENSLEGEITQNLKATGYRLPTAEEWYYAVKGGENYTYSGSDNLNEVGWYDENSNYKTHQVALKKPNAYGLYDMSGNVRAWCWDVNPYYGHGSHRFNCGGSYDDDYYYCKVDSSYSRDAYRQNSDLGFRIVCSASN